MPTTATIILVLSLGALSACSPAPRAAPTKPAAAPTSPPPPARMAIMVCRNSQNGRKVACGTPNAVMVGMTYEDASKTR